MRNMLFARTFPAYHPKKGLPTNFIQKIWANPHIVPMNEELLGLGNVINQNAFLAKGHTIRAGNHWRVGDHFKPLVWSGKPYRSKTIQIANPIMVEKEWKIKFDECGVISINGFYDYSEIVAADNFMEVLARNDGLTQEDLHFLFPLGKAFEGQIICWNKNINYE